MSLSSPGIGSGLDVNAIVDQLVAIERRPITLLETAKTRLDTQLSSYGLMQSYMANLQSIAAKLADPANWTRNSATSSDPAVGVTASAGAAAASYAVEVQQLAASQSLSSAVFADPSDLGTGTLTITRGADSFDIEIAAGQTSLQAVRDQINAAGAGVTASIVNDAGGPLLVLTADETGSANAFGVSVAGATGSLASLAYPGGMVERRAAADAQFTINGVPLSSAKNQLDSVIDGVSLTLTRLTSAPVEVTIAADKAAMSKDIGSFIAAYNDLNRFLAAQTRYDEASREAGALQGDRTAVGLISKLRALVQVPSPASAVFGRLSDLGISMQKDGSLQLDQAKLDAALADPAEVGKALSASGNGLMHGFEALADGMLGSEGALTLRSEGLQASIDRNERDQERLEDRVERVRERLMRQYSALDITIGQLSGLGSLVTQQLDALSNFYKQSSK
ncbi:MAG: flagellar filament capping protein FliD [Burkholderiales bacterium]|nr:flagellar filament capping protein FliD [Burkholderiales bacterium]